MKMTRKKYVLDKKFQYRISARAIVLPLLTTLTVCAVLIFVAQKNNHLVKNSNRYINHIVETQDSMVEMFLSVPALNRSENPAIQNGIATFRSNIGRLRYISQNSERIVRNSSLVLYILIALTVIQTVVIFSMFIRFSHRISGPVMVMTRYLRQIREGERPRFRPLRRDDELQGFYREFRETMEYLAGEQKAD